MTENNEWINEALHLVNFTKSNNFSNAFLLQLVKDRTEQSIRQYFRRNFMDENIRLEFRISLQVFTVY